MFCSVDAVEEMKPSVNRKGEDMKALFLYVSPIMCLLALAGCRDREKPNMPVKVIVRESIVGEGLVAQFHNETPHRLVVDVILQDKNDGNKKSGALVLQANAVTEIGWMEGWKFMSGDTIKISHDDYKTVTYRIP